MDSIIDFIQSTMLIERLIGVCTYILTLGYFFNKIKKASSVKIINKNLNYYLITLCLLAFFYIPGESADLTRWREMSEVWSNFDFEWFWEHRIQTSSVPAGYLLVYLCQSTGINGILPMICAFGFFGNIFHMLKNEAKRENVNSDSVALTLFFVMSTGFFLEAISGVRCMLAFSIVIRCAYDEMRLNKNIIYNIFFYIFAVLLHNAAMPLTGMRFICLLFEKKKKPVWTIINFLIALGSILLALRLGNDYIDAALEKATLYMSQNTYSYIWEYIIASIGILLILYVLYKLKKRYPMEWIRTKAPARYLLLNLVYTLFFFNVYSIFHRFFSASLICSIPIIIEFFSCEYAKQRYKMRFSVVLVLLIILLLASIRGNLSGYKFFYLG